jgi:hypothetical protein
MKIFSPIIIKTILVFGIVVTSAGIQIETRAETQTPSGDRTILIQESNGKNDPAKVFVESGSEEIAGSPEAGLKPAYRTWEHACKEWKNELDRRNGKNLLVASCGTPRRTSEKVQSEMIYTYQSLGKYKIKVLGK